MPDTDRNGNSDNTLPGSVDPVEGMVCDGRSSQRLSEGDAAEVRRFAAFLRAAGPKTGDRAKDRARMIGLYQEHYPQDFSEPDLEAGTAPETSTEPGTDPDSTQGKGHLF